VLNKELINKEFPLVETSDLKLYLSEVREKGSLPGLKKIKRKMVPVTKDGTGLGLKVKFKVKKMEG